MPSPMETSSQPEFVVSTSGRNKLTPQGRTFLRTFFDRVSQNPTVEQKEELAKHLQGMDGCSHYDITKVNGWFTRAKKSAAKHQMAQTSRTILYPSLTNDAIASLEVLDREHPYEWSPTIIDVFATQLKATSKDVRAWIAIRREGIQSPSRSTTRLNGDEKSPKGELASHSQLPTPAISTSPEPMLPTPISPNAPSISPSSLIKPEPSHSPHMPNATLDNDSLQSPPAQNPMVAFARHIVPPHRYQSFITSNGDVDGTFQSAGVSASTGVSHRPQTLQQRVTSFAQREGVDFSVPSHVPSAWPDPAPTPSSTPTTSRPNTATYPLPWVAPPSSTSPTAAKRSVPSCPTPPQWTPLVIMSSSPSRDTSLSPTDDPRSTSDLQGNKSRSLVQTSVSTSVPSPSVEPSKLVPSTRQRLRNALETARSSSMTEEPPPSNTQEWNKRWMKIEPIMNEYLEKLGKGNV